MNNRLLLLPPGPRSMYSPLLLPAEAATQTSKTKKHVGKSIVYLRYGSVEPSDEKKKKITQDNILEQIFFVSALNKVRTFSLTPGAACEKSSSPQAVEDLPPLLIKDQARQPEPISKKNGGGHTSHLLVHPVHRLLSTTICA